jgi:hypothetical protein
MLYLYLGYLLIQLIPVVNKIYHENSSSSAVLFSIVVFLIWSFIPILGFIFSKLFRSSPQYPSVYFISYGALVALIEIGLFHFNMLNSEQYIIGVGISFILFFILAYIPMKNLRT